MVTLEGQRSWLSRRICALIGYEKAGYETVRGEVTVDRPTMQTVATAAGVSRMTVSNACNVSPSRSRIFQPASQPGADQSGALGGDHDGHAGQGHQRRHHDRALVHQD